MISSDGQYFKKKSLLTKQTKLQKQTDEIKARASAEEGMVGQIYDSERTLRSEQGRLIGVLLSTTALEAIHAIREDYEFFTQRSFKMVRLWLIYNNLMLRSLLHQ